jgi:EmrB/QacA subfamily drug resistance transporter
MDSLPIGAAIAIPAERRVELNRLWALGLLCSAQFMVVVDSAVVNVAIPSIQRDLHFSTSSIQWVFNAYLLAYGGLLLLGGRTADLLGRRRMFIVGAGVMSAASLFAGLSVTQGELIAARAIQGVGAAVITPAALSMILRLFQENAERNRALGIWGALAGMGAATGVLLGGVITQGPGWQWIFYINVPVAAAVAALSPRLLPETRAESGSRTFDVADGIAITAGLVVAVYAVVEAPDNGWGSAATIGLLALGLLLIGAFVWIELRTRVPLLRMGIFRIATVAGANAVVFLVTGAFFATLFLLTLYMQQVLGYSAIKTGLAYLPLALGVVAASIMASRVVTLCGVKFMLLMSAPVFGVGLFILSRASATSSFAGTLLPAFLIVAFAVGVAMVALSIAAFAGIGEGDFGVASGLYNTSGQIGGAVGVAVLSTVAYSHIRGAHPAAGPHGLTTVLGSAYADGFGAGIALLGAALLITMLAIRQRHVKTWTCATPYRFRVFHRKPVVAAEALIEEADRWF